MFAVALLSFPSFCIGVDGEGAGAGGWVAAAFLSLLSFCTGKVRPGGCPAAFSLGG